VPDLAVEIRSPSDRTGAVLEKVGQWLDAGVAIVWVIDPQRRTAQYFAADGTIRLFGAHDTLDADPVLPTLQVPLAPLWNPS
jgi:Uma2 family endonuclease